MYVLMGCMLCVRFVFAQPPLQELPAVQPPQVIMPSPDVAQFIKYVDYPITYQTGLPDIRLPLYTLETPELRLPLSLSYYGGGIKARETASTVGLGWSLNAGGVITRVVKGMPDDAATFKLKSVNEVFALGNKEALSYFSMIDRGELDVSYDRYYFTIGDESGSFILNPKTYEITQIPQTDNVIRPIHIHRQGQYDVFDFELIRPDGSYYLFTAKEMLDPAIGDGRPSYLQSWHLTSIFSANRTDTITLSYLEAGNWSKVVHSDVRIRTNSEIDKQYEEPIPCRTNYEIRPTATTQQYLNCKLLNSIRHRGQTLEFGYVSDRTDEGLPYRLDHIRVLCPDTLLRIQLLNENSYFGNKKLKLSGLLFIGKNGILSDKKSFTYIDENYPMPNPCAEDYFGYYNGAANWTGYTFFTENSCSDTRRHSFDFARKYALETIATVTGGITRFVYESNTCTDCYTHPVSIGLRIAAILTLEGGRQVKSRKFVYRGALSSIDFRELTLTDYLSARADANNQEGIVYNYLQTVYSPTCLLPGASVEEAKIYYKYVDEYICDTRDSLKISYEYDMSGCQSLHQAINPSANCNFNYYNCISQREDFQINGYFIEKIGDHGFLKTQTTCRKEGNTYIPETKKTFTYQSCNAGTYLSDFFSRLYTASANGIVIQEIANYLYFDVLTEYGSYKKTSEQTEYYYPEGTVTQLETFDYHVMPAPLSRFRDLLLKSHTLTAGGRTYRHDYYYPADSASVVCDSMVKRNIIEPIVREDFFVDGQLRACLKRSYGFFADTKKIGLKKESEEREGTQIGYIHYESRTPEGSIRVLSAHDMPSTVYLWGYQSCYPVAEIRNATYGQVVTALGGQQKVDEIAAAPQLSSAQIALLQGLRTALPQSQVSVYTYKPVTGITSVTDPSGRKTTYTYDNCNRLQAIWNEDGTVEKTYEYHYKN